LSPRVKPKRTEELRRKIAQDRLSFMERSPYGPGSEYSYFRDLALVALNDGRRREAEARTGLPASGSFIGEVHPVHGALEEAQRRLAIAVERAPHEREYRDLTTGDPGGAGVIPTGAPVTVAEAFASALRAKAVLASVLRREPLPEAGMVVEAPRIATGVGVAVQASQLGGVQETDPDTDVVSSPVATIAGQVDLSRQLFDRALIDADRWIGQELGEAAAAVLDSQVMNGSGSSGQLRGLLNVSGVTTIARTQASPTAATNYSGLGDLYRATAEAYGGRPSAIVLAPRRFAFIEAELDRVPNYFDLEVVVSASVPVNLGGGSNEDRPIFLAADEIVLFLGEPRFSVFPEAGSVSATVRIRVHQFAALLAGRKPASIGVGTGTEWQTPTF
jgi:hypothetical protein